MCICVYVYIFFYKDCCGYQSKFFNKIKCLRKTFFLYVQEKNTYEFLYIFIFLYVQRIHRQERNRQKDKKICKKKYFDTYTKTVIII